MKRFGTLIAGISVVVTIAAHDGLLMGQQEPSSAPLKLLLHVDYRDDASRTYYQGEPIAVQVALIDERFHLKGPRREWKEKRKEVESQLLTVGNKEWPWFKGIAIQVEKVKKTKVKKKADGGSSTVPVLQEPDWAKRIVRPRPGAHVKNQPGYHALIYVFSIDLHASESLAVGRYIVKAAWDSTKPPARDMDIWHARLEAKPIQIVIVPARTKEDKGKLAFCRASYYIRLKDFDAALREALKAEELFPSYQLSQCYVIAARAYQGKGDIRSAIRYYRKFLDAHKEANVQRWPYIKRLRQTVKLLEERLNKTPDAGKPESR